MRERKPIDPVVVLQRENGKLRRELKTLSEAIQVFLHIHDERMREPSTVERGRKIAQLSNWLDKQNDLIRYTTLGIDFRKDDKDREAKRIIKRITPVQNPPTQNAPGA